MPKKQKPHTREESKLRKRGHEHIAGVDEAGRGSWAGPIVAAAVVLPKGFDAAGCFDSKMMTPAQRERAFVKIVRNAISWSVAVVPPETIDRKGISYANKLVLQQAVKKLHVKPHAVLVDAVKITHGKKPVTAIIDGDAKVLSIAAASIIAKVARDALMTGYHRQYPKYNFQQHKGYGTAAHRMLLKRYGLSPIHRKSFRPMKAGTH